jgi:hypothetical protein
MAACLPRPKRLFEGGLTRTGPEGGPWTCLMDAACVAGDQQEGERVDTPVSNRDPRSTPAQPIVGGRVPLRR